MEPIITAEMLASTGIIIKEDELVSYLDHINEQLNDRVGQAIAENLSDEEIDILADLEEKASEEELGQWIAKHIPDLDDIIEDEIDILLGEATENSDTINTLEE
ncbi:MAG: hypothetical protein JWM52_761 [Candidatus Saccharibacteria bacterium]|nr:hypothetical protein [Candidatus Saccharibacteria bacterium]